MIQTIDAGYDEVLCIMCANAAGSTTQHDNWRVHQVRNCATALVGATQGSPVPNKIINFVDNAALVEQAAGSASFFTNPFNGECGVITACSIKAAGCTDAYTGDKLSITSNTGKVESK